MKKADTILCIIFFMLLLVQGGCEPSQINTEPASKVIKDANELSIYARYAPAKAQILPLTEFINIRDEEKQPEMKVYISLLDSFGAQIKSPGIFRFELYEYVLRSARPKGKRVFISKDFDLRNPDENNKHWRDFLRAYLFILPYEPEKDKSYMLQATCMCPNGRRLSTELALKQIK